MNRIPALCCASMKFPRKLYLVCRSSASMQRDTKILTKPKIAFRSHSQTRNVKEYMGDMRMYQDERRLDFHALGREIKRKREAKGWTQEYLAQLVDRTPRSIMYFENRGQHPSLNTFYKIVTLLDISVDQFFYPDKQNEESDCRQHIDRMLNTMDENELTIMEATAEGIQKARETEGA